MSQFSNDSIFWIEVDKIRPNPYQPRREFNEATLNELSESIRQYGVLQPLVVTRQEEMREDGGLSVFYELIAGERRLRASRMAGLSQVPVLIRSGEETDRMKLELAIIENLQREDLNPIDRAHAFSKLVNDFGFKHGQVGQKVGKSREYVSNTLRLLAMPEEIQQAILDGLISEGHSRPILMLSDRPEEQNVLFREILLKKLSVREAETISRNIATEKIRNKKYLLPPDILALEKTLTEQYGTRVHIEQHDGRGKVVIDFTDNEDLRTLLYRLNQEREEAERENAQEENGIGENEDESSQRESVPEEQQEGDDDLYSIRNFSI